jgi:hypothetical protein
MRTPVPAQAPSTSVNAFGQDSPSQPYVVPAATTGGYGQLSLPPQNYGPPSQPSYNQYQQPSQQPTFGQPLAPSSYGQPPAPAYGQPPAPSAYDQPTGPSIYGQPPAPPAFGHSAPPVPYGQQPAGMPAMAVAPQYGYGQPQQPQNQYNYY